MKNENIEKRVKTLNGVTYNILFIKGLDDLRCKLSGTNTNLFRIILRKNVIYDEQGTYIKEFCIYSKNNKICCPMITYNEEEDYSYVTDTNTIYTRPIEGDVADSLDGMYIAVDAKLQFSPYDLYIPLQKLKRGIHLDNLHFIRFLLF